MATTSYYDDHSGISLPAAAAIGKHLRVKLDANGRVLVAAGTDAGVGYTTRSAAAIDEMIAIRSPKAPSQIVTAAEAIAVGSKVYGDAAGKVGETATNVYLGVALTAAGADGDIMTSLAGDGDH